MKKDILTAFTLIELLVVIAIIGILSGLIIVGMSSSVNSAKIAKAQIFSSSLKDSLLGNLVSEWKFDDTASLGKDYWSTNNCTVSGVTLQSSGCVYGSCLSFDGNDSLTCGNDASLNMTNSITLSGWIKSPAVATGMIICKRSQTQYRIYKENNDKLYFGIQIGGVAVGVGSISTIGSSWHNFTATYDGATVKIYFDGTMENSASASGSIATSTYDLKLGTQEGSYNLIGTIDDVRIYNAAIQASQIKQQYFSGLNNLIAKENLSLGEYSDKIRKL